VSADFLQIGPRGYVLQDTAISTTQDTTEPPNPGAAVEATSSGLRSDLIDRVLKALLADAERAEGTLKRTDIDRAYIKRNLTIPECELVEKRLRDNPIRIIEDEDEDEDDSGSPSESPVKRRRIPYLTEIEERELGRKIQLARRIKDGGEPADASFAARTLLDAERAKTRFVETNIRYVQKLAWERRFLRHLSADDLFQEGVMGLLHATELFDPELGFRFKTYATWWIRQHMHRAFDDQERTIRLPVHVQESIRKIRRKRVTLALELNREPTLAELANYIGVDKERLAKLLWRLQVTDCAEADAPITEDGDSIISFKPDETPSALEILAEQQLRTSLSSVLASLPPRTERILRMRFGLDEEGEKTLEAIGQIFGVTRERIRQIEARALRVLKHPSRSRILRSFID
jgi:RNA polymerase primary sigma factor